MARGINQAEKTKKLFFIKLATVQNEPKLSFPDVIIRVLVVNASG